jgi:hypothetical protein
MTAPPRSAAAVRKRRDRLIAAAIAIVVLATGVVVYLTSDARATSLVVAPDSSAPAAMVAAPDVLQQIWQTDTDQRWPAVASPYGTVVTADGHTVYGSNPLTGEVRWSYTRDNLDMCVMGSGDTDAPGIELGGAVRGVLVGYIKSGRCSELTLLDPVTGERRDQRTGFTGADSALVFGGPYGGLVSDDLVELWRYDLVRTIQYGNQPEPTKPNTKHLGCTFADIAVTSVQFGTIEHCDGLPNAQLVLNYADPGATADARTKNWDALNYDPRATVDLGSASARLLAVSQDAALVLVASPTPALVTYTDAGVETSRIPVTIDPAQIAAADADRVTPVRMNGATRYVLVGDTLFAVSDGLVVNWTMPAALGLPAAVGAELLVPVADGVAVVNASDGATGRVIPVDRAGYTGRVDVNTVGSTVVESRGASVVALRDPAAPLVDATVASTDRGRQTGGVRLPTAANTGSPAGAETSGTG